MRIFVVVIAFVASIATAFASPLGCSPRDRLPSPRGHDFTVTGNAEPCDGDELVIGARDYRLNGIDAFEVKQYQVCGIANCPALATAELRRLVAGQRVRCRDMGDRDNERVIARCTDGKGDSIEDAMVRNGWAFVRPNFLSKDTARRTLLCGLEEQAAGAGRGVWAYPSWAANNLPFFAKGGARRKFEQMTCRHKFRRGFR